MHACLWQIIALIQCLPLFDWTQQQNSMMLESWYQFSRIKSIEKWWPFSDGLHALISSNRTIIYRKYSLHNYNILIVRSCHWILSVWSSLTMNDNWYHNFILSTIKRGNTVISTPNTSIFHLPMPERSYNKCSVIYQIYPPGVGAINAILG